jgi:hypothetical protein
VPNKFSGLGLHLQSLAQLLPDKYDLHELTRTLASLGPYDHLRRLVRICSVHAKRNIQKCNVSEDVRKLMRSLLCLTHPDWDGTLELIRQHGGKAGAGGVYYFCGNESTNFLKTGCRIKFEANLPFRQFVGSKVLFLVRSGMQATRQAI